jgi:hypothetical protein
LFQSLGIFEEEDDDDHEEESSISEFRLKYAAEAYASGATPSTHAVSSP